MSRMFLDSGGNPFPAIAPYIVQSLSIGSSSVQSTAFNAATTLVEIIPTSNCWVTFGSNPTAVKPTNTQASGQGFYIAAGTSKFYSVQPGSLVAVIQDSTTGILSIIEAQ